MAFKYTSETFQISASVTETAPNTLTTQTINLNLDSLSREILVIEMVDLDVSAPELIGGARTQMNVSLNDADIGVGGLGTPRVVATANNIIAADVGLGMAVSFQNSEPKFAQTSDNPIYVSATDDLFLSIQGIANGGIVGQGQCRIFARRAQATADTYAAILTSQFNS